MVSMPGTVMKLSAEASVRLEDGQASCYLTSPYVSTVARAARPSAKDFDGEDIVQKDACCGAMGLFLGGVGEWKKEKANAKTLIDIRSAEILMRGHSGYRVHR